MLDELDRRFRSGELQVAVEIPRDYGRDLQRPFPEVAVWLDGGMPFHAETRRVMSPHSSCNMNRI